MRAIVIWGWCPALIMALAIVGYRYELPIEALATAMAIILVIGLIVAISSTREKELERSSLKLRELAGYFTRRFTGNSSLSIFAIIDSLFNVDNPKLWEWARACDMSRRIFDTWCSGFMARVETDIRTRRFTVYLRTYLNELWLACTHYHEFIEQFHEIAKNVEIPREAIEQYNRFATEYNAFAQDFRSYIAELRKVAKTEIEPPSVKLATELSVGK